MAMGFIKERWQLMLFIIVLCCILWLLHSEMFRMQHMTELEKESLFIGNILRTFLIKLFSQFSLFSL